ncbi:signal-transducing adaptor protein 2b isoform X1 [Silurus meridionalis]|uniref:signal-transducing adaptor protein 2b isoform X1 n=1 Tax=Silurus meridionalis TaxID=175797 RepID=UPI001EEB4759|nr:signal-transducing adaptor protein 2b isoform X1 [Silurus meridionalis]
MRRAQRNKSQLPPCYYEGFLEKRSFKDKVGRRLWTALCGNSLFFYNNNKDNDYVEKQDLSNFISLTDDLSMDRKLDAARLHLRLKEDDIYLTAPSLEARELWKGFIFSIVKLEVPTSLNLLPGQIYMLKKALEQETERRKELAEKSAVAQAPVSVPMTEPGDYLSLHSEMPACFYRVFRDEAMLLLEKHKEQGNLLLRLSRDGSAFAVTTRQDFNGPVFRHYRVTRIPDGSYAIAIDNPIICPTLHHVTEYLIEKTGGVFKPLVLEHTYEKNIVFVEDNQENGERTLRTTSDSPVAPKVSPIPAPRQKKCSKEENIYVDPSDEENNVNQDKPYPSPALSPAPGGKVLVHQKTVPDMRIGPGGALLPPNERPRSATMTDGTRPKRPAPTMPVQEILNDELRRALQLRYVSD